MPKAHRQEAAENVPGISVDSAKLEVSPDRRAHPAGEKEERGTCEDRALNSGTDGGEGSVF